MLSWVEQELQGVNLGDALLNSRLMKMVNDFAANPNASIPQACGEWNATKAAYRFFSSERVKPEDIQAAHRKCHPTGGETRNHTPPARYHKPGLHPPPPHQEHRIP